MSAGHENSPVRHLPVPGAENVGERAAHWGCSDAACKRIPDLWISGTDVHLIPHQHLSAGQQVRVDRDEWPRDRAREKSDLRGIVRARIHERHVYWTCVPHVPCTIPGICGNRVDTICE